MGRLMRAATVASLIATASAGGRPATAGAEPPVVRHCSPFSYQGTRTRQVVARNMSCAFARSRIRGWIIRGLPGGRFGRDRWICSYSTRRGGNCSIAATIWVTFRSRLLQ